MAFHGLSYRYKVKVFTLLIHKNNAALYWCMACGYGVTMSTDTTAGTCAGAGMHVDKQTHMHTQG